MHSVVVAMVCVRADDDVVERRETISAAHGALLKTMKQTLYGAGREEGLVWLCKRAFGRNEDPITWQLVEEQEREREKE